MITMTIYTLHSKASSKILIYTVTKGAVWRRNSNSENMTN